MRGSTPRITRRQTLSGLAGTSALAVLPACAARPAAPAMASAAPALAGLAPDAALD
jgi:hypothetical protein